MIKADLAAHRLRFRTYALSDFALAGASGPDRVSVDTLKFALAGGDFQAKATAESAGKATRLHLTAGLPNGDLGALLKTLGMATDQIAGTLSTRVELDAIGAELGDALAHSNGFAVLAMVDGRVSRDLLEKASTDLRTLFRKGEGMSPVGCLLGVARIQDGVATLSPLTLRTPDATLRGAGTIDLVSNKLDLRIKSDPKSTGFFALDIPIRISGGLDAPSAKPMAQADFKQQAAPADLPKSITQVAESSGCSR